MLCMVRPRSSSLAVACVFFLFSNFKLVSSEVVFACFTPAPTTCQHILMPPPRHACSAAFSDLTHELRTARCLNYTLAERTKLACSGCQQLKRLASHGSWLLAPQRSQVLSAARHATGWNIPPKSPQARTTKRAEQAAHESSKTHLKLASLLTIVAWPIRAPRLLSFTQPAGKSQKADSHFFKAPQ